MSIRSEEVEKNFIRSCSGLGYSSGKVKEQLWRCQGNLTKGARTSFHLFGLIKDDIFTRTTGSQSPEILLEKFQTVKPKEEETL